MDKKIIAIGVVVIVVAASAILLLTGSSGPATKGGTSGPATGTPAGNGAPASGTPAGGKTNCGSDQTCLLTNFMACSPATFSMPFVQGEYVVEVIGLESGNCHYTLSNFAVDINCSVPKELITEDRVGHLFGMDKNPGKEQVLAQQNALDSTYCNQTAKEIPA
jgi:hypothetical protein